MEKGNARHQRAEDKSHSGGGSPGDGKTESRRGEVHVKHSRISEALERRRKRRARVRKERDKLLSRV
jgi:50S ribosomal subunit-associated GTPase HflX